MVIEIKFYGPFKKYASKETTDKMIISENAKVLDLLKLLGISLETPKIVLVNDRQVNLETEIKSGDIVSIVPPIAGG